MAEFQFDTTAMALLGLLVVLAAIAVALVVYVVRNARRAPSASPEAPAPRALAPGESATLADVLAGGASPDPFLMQFVTDPKGERVGESITVHEGRLVLKHEGRFLAVPLERVTVKDGTLTTAADEDWAEAERAGEAWRVDRHDAIAYDAQGNPLPK